MGGVRKSAFVPCPSRDGTITAEGAAVACSKIASNVARLDQWEIHRQSQQRSDAAFLAPSRSEVHRIAFGNLMRLRNCFPSERSRAFEHARLERHHKYSINARRSQRPLQKNPATEHPQELPVLPWKDCPSSAVSPEQTLSPELERLSSSGPRLFAAATLANTTRASFILSPAVFITVGDTIVRISSSSMRADWSASLRSIIICAQILPVDSRYTQRRYVVSHLLHHSIRGPFSDFPPTIGQTATTWSRRFSQRFANPRNRENRANADERIAWTNHNPICFGNRCQARPGRAAISRYLQTASRARSASRATSPDIPGTLACHAAYRLRSARGCRSSARFLLSRREQRGYFQQFW